MGVRQYIGARYVPLFAGDWDNEQVYEPLTIVQYQGASYTSKQSVPRGVAITNTEYWAVTGNYNAQVEQYRAEVRQYDGRITGNTEVIDEHTEQIAAAGIRIGAVEDDIAGVDERLEVVEGKVEDNAEEIAANAKAIAGATEVSLYKGKDAVAFGDSFTDPDNYRSDYGRWFNIVCTKLGMAGHNYAVGGARFTTHTQTIAMQLTRAASEMTAAQKENTAVVFVYGGFNDINNMWDSTNQQVITDDMVLDAIESAITSIGEMFPNAKIVFAPFNWGKGSLGARANEKIMTLCFLIRRRINAQNVAFTENARYWIIGNDTNFSADNVHPSQTGYRMIAQAFTSLLLGGNDDCSIGGSLSISPGTNKSNAWYFMNGRTSFEWYSDFGGNLGPDNNPVVLASDIPYYLVSSNDRLIPVMKADGTVVGCLQIKRNRQLVINFNQQLTANTYVFAAPTTFMAECHYPVD